MEFLVVVCSKCKWARGVRSTSKRVKCTRCGSTIDVVLAKPFGRTNNELDLAKAVGEVNEMIHRRGKVSGLSAQRDNRKDQRTTCQKQNSQDRRKVILELGHRQAEFSFDDVLSALSRVRSIPVSEVDKDEVTKAIDELLMKGLIIEIRYGHYKAV